LLHLPSLFQRVCLFSMGAEPPAWSTGASAGLTGQRV